jgi:4'-phosphopantetheinyl transferase
MRTKLYLASTKALRDEARFARLLETVPDQRREKVLAFRPDSARRLSLGAGLLLKLALAADGLKADEIRVTEYGKPYFPALPDFHFSLSHSGERVLCAVSALPVGCDIEKLGRDTASLARRFFHPKERDWLFSLPEEEQGAAFFQIWTGKESFIKAIGLGLSQPLDSFAMLPGEPVALTQNVDPRPWRIRSFREGDYFAALCALENVEDAVIIPVNF